MIEQNKINGLSLVGIGLTAFGVGNQYTNADIQYWALMGIALILVVVGFVEGIFSSK